MSYRAQKNASKELHKCPFEEIKVDLYSLPLAYQTHVWIF